MNNSLKVYLRKHVFYGHMCWLLMSLLLWPSVKRRQATVENKQLCGSKSFISNYTIWHGNCISRNLRGNYHVNPFKGQLHNCLCNHIYKLKHHLCIEELLGTRKKKYFHYYVNQVFVGSKSLYFWKVSFIGDNNLIYFIHILLRF